MPPLRLVLPLALAALACGADAPAPSTSGPRRADPAPTDTLVADGDLVPLDSAVVARLVAEDPLWADALRIHFDALVIDGHVDTPTEMLLRGYDLGARHRASGGSAHVDLPRMTEGGLDAPFFSLWVSRQFGEGPRATARALAMLDEVERQLAALPDAEIARTSDDVRRITRGGGAAILLGLEGGHALAGDVDVLRDLAARGVRYVTLTHTNTNRLADSSQDEPRHGGLSPLGEAMVREMNRLGVLPDVSHVSDSTLADVLRVSQGPVLASHSSARALVANPRNLTDDQMRGIARTGGVVMINAYSPMVNGRLTEEVMDAAMERLRTRHGGDLGQLWRAIAEEQRARGIPEATLDDVLDHIEHAVEIAGADHVGLGTDFDGVPQLPAGFGDVTRLPWVTYGLLRRGMPEADVRKVLGANALRALEEAERLAADLRE